MSHNLTLSGYGGLYQTQTDNTEAILAAGSREQIAEEYLRRYVRNRTPEALRGREARNPYLIREREQQVARLDEEAERLRTYLRENPEARWGST